MKEGFNMFKRIKRYFRKSIVNVNYELKYEKEIEKHEKTKIKLSEAYDRIKFLEKELDRNYQNARIVYLQKIIRRKNRFKLQRFICKNTKLSN